MHFSKSARRVRPSRTKSAHPSTVILSGAPRGVWWRKDGGRGCAVRRAVEGPLAFSVRQARRQRKLEVLRLRAAPHTPAPHRHLATTSSTTTRRSAQDDRIWRSAPTVHNTL